MFRFWWCWGDAVLGVSSAVWLATQTRNNDAMRPPVPSKNGILAVSASLSASLLARVYPAELVGQILDEQGVNSVRVRSLPADVVASRLTEPTGLSTGKPFA